MLNHFGRVLVKSYALLNRKSFKVLWKDGGRRERGEGKRGGVGWSGGGRRKEKRKGGGKKKWERTGTGPWIW